MPATNTARTAPIIIRYKDFGRDGKYVTVLCGMGHLITAKRLDNSFGGSQLEADLGDAAAGLETHWHRLSAKCCGTGH